MRILKLFSNAFMRLLPAILSADLLYLYYGGHWYDPVKVIELTEIILLYLFTLISIVWVIEYIKAEGKDARSNH